MVYMPTPNCMTAAVAASKGRLTQQEILEAFSRMADYKRRLEASGQATGKAERLRKFAEQEGDRARIAAALRRRHTALNILVRARLDESLDNMARAGIKPHKALLTILEGSQANVRNARKSVSAQRQAFERRYLGAMLSDLQRDAPHLVRMLGDQRLDADVMRELAEVNKAAGNPGVTGNADALTVARLFSRYAELARTDLNSLGASIGKLDGWAGVQMHDDIKMIAAGKDAWVGTVSAYLDVERTFPEGLEPAEVVNILGDIYDTIITGLPNNPNAVEIGGRVNPANLARSLGKSRVLHFKDVDAQIAYREAFGYGNTVAGMFGHLRNAARVGAVMEVLGPNPEVMFRAVAERLKRDVRNDPSIDDRAKQRRINALETQAGVLRHALDIATGTNARPVNVDAAKIGADIRAWQSMSKLGGATISALSDTITVGAAAQFRGGNFFSGFARQLAGIFEGRGKGEVGEISFLIGEGFDGLIGHIVNPHVAQDGPVGAMAKLQEHFFRWNGLTWWTDANRASAGRMIAAEMGMRSRVAFDQLPPAYRHVLELNGIDAMRWDIIRQTRLRQANGAEYVTPDRIRELPDDAFLPLLGTRKVTPASIAEVRRGLELDVLRFFADETSYSVIKTDARTTRYMTGGNRPGTMAGEGMRFLMQFKGFPIAFTERVVGRAIYGHRAGAKAGERAAHIGSLLAGLIISGYVSMTMKDVLKGYWPPRDPGDWRTWVAAGQQGGAWGIYGDFLFSQTNRFGGGFLETLAGPTFGSFGDLAEIGLQARDYALDTAIGDDGGRFAGGKALSWLVGNTPYANLFYVKPALDYLALNSLRETLSPGYLRRQERTRQRQYGQERWTPTGATVQGDLGQ